MGQEFKVIAVSQAISLVGCFIARLWKSVYFYGELQGSKEETETEDAREMVKIFHEIREVAGSDR